MADPINVIGQHPNVAPMRTVTTVTACMVDGQLVEAEPVRAWRTSDGQLFQHREDADAHLETLAREARERVELETRERRFDAVLDALRPDWATVISLNAGGFARWIVDHRDALLEALS